MRGEGFGRNPEYASQHVSHRKNILRRDLIPGPFTALETCECLNHCTTGHPAVILYLLTRRFLPTPGGKQGYLPIFVCVSVYVCACAPECVCVRAVKAHMLPVIQGLYRLLLPGTCPVPSLYPQPTLQAIVCEMFEPQRAMFDSRQARCCQEISCPATTYFRPKIASHLY